MPRLWFTACDAWSYSNFHGDVVVWSNSVRVKQGESVVWLIMVRVRSILVGWVRI